jgi:hypothetical protein
MFDVEHPAYVEAFAHKKNPKSTPAGKTIVCVGVDGMAAVEPLKITVPAL